MKKIEISGITLHYKVTWEHSEYDSYCYTSFFLLNGKKPEVKWSWKKLRKVETGVMVDNYIEMFRLPLDVESDSYTKREIREKIGRKIELMGRAKEIQKGEIV